MTYCAGDDVESWGWDLFETLEEYGRATSCDAIEFRGRHGWIKYAKGAGYKDVARIYRKQL